MSLLQQHLTETADFLRELMREPARQSSDHAGIRAVVVLGSGLGGFAETLQNSQSIPYERIPNFPKATVEGHTGCLTLGEVAPGFTIACMQGRFHRYEGHAMDRIAFPIRTLRQLGAEFLIVTNAAGGIHPDFEPGTLMLIEDHINLMGDNPLTGENPAFLGPRFLDMTAAYCPELRRIALEAASSLDLSLKSGVYAALSGPCYETPAEVRMLRTLGADAVGMSTVPEVIAANHMAMRTLGFSCIANAAAGLSAGKLCHADVIETVRQSQQQFMMLLNAVLRRMAAECPLEAV